MAGNHDDAEAAAAIGRRIVCLTGPESTGKTTLAEALAAHFGGTLVPEVARAYLMGRSGYAAEDVLAIAQLQLEAETRALAEGEGLVVCDTDLLVIQVWWEEKYGELPEELAAAIAERSERHYLLLAPDLPWTADPLRESPLDRERLYARYEALLSAGGFPWGVVAGEGEARLQAALAAIRAVFPELE